MTTPEPEEPRRDVPAADRDIHIRVKLATTDPSLRPRAAVYQVILDRLTLLLRSSALGLDDADMAARRRYVADALAESQPELIEHGSARAVELVAEITARLRSGEPHDPEVVIEVASVMADEIDAYWVGRPGPEPGQSGEGSAL